MSVRHIAISVEDQRPRCGSKSKRVYSSIPVESLRRVCGKCMQLYKNEQVEKRLTNPAGDQRLSGTTFDASSFRPSNPDKPHTWLVLKSPTS